MGLPPLPKADSAADSKSAFKSKTIWGNLLLASAVELHPQIGTWVVAHPQTAVLVMAALNIGIRHVTAGGLSWRKHG